MDITLLQLDDRAAPLSLRMTGSDAGQTEKLGLDEKDGGDAGRAVALFISA